MTYEGKDAEVVRKVRSGDRESFGVLVERYEQVAFRSAYVVLRDTEEARDVVQEAFVRAYRSLGSFQIDEAFRPWLLRIVMNLSFNAVRSRKRRDGLLRRLHLQPLLSPRDPGPEEVQVATDESGALLQAMKQLNEDDQAVLYLRYFVELPEREIAAAIGRPAGTVKSRLHRASARLRARIERDFPWLIPEGVDGR